MGSADAGAQSAEQGANTQPADTGAQSSGSQLEEVVVTGFRSSLEKGIELKREAVGVRDSIVAEDIGKFPEQNVAESLQRIPGVFLTRDGASNASGLPTARQPVRTPVTFRKPRRSATPVELMATPRASRPWALDTTFAGRGHLRAGRPFKS